MCRFRIKVLLCGCEDYDCKQKNPELNENDFMQMWDTGHILRIIEYFRDGPMCMDYFVNDDPNRLVVRYGLDPTNANSRQDCRRRTFRIQMEQLRAKVTCRECLTNCCQDLMF